MQAPELQIDTWLNGGPHELSSLRGKVVALHFFQMLCPGCVVHGMPQAQKLHDAFKEDPRIQVAAIHSVFEHHDVMTPEALRVFVSEFRYTLPIAIDRPDPEGSIPRTMRAYGCRGTPTWILIDPEGEVVANLFGRPTDLEMGLRIGELLPRAHGGECSEDGCKVPLT
ncbi:MAG: peroxiredoxin family protein [Methylohalobius sp. ZOD2]